MTTPHQSAFEQAHRLRGTALAFLLDRDSKALAQRAQSGPAGRAARTLAKEGPLRVTLTAVKAGVSLQPHQVAGPSTIQALSGKARFETPAGTTVLPAGALMVLDAGVTHRVTAIEDCVLLMTIVQPLEPPQ
jgi:quercetin dioxygenase-like cupin family protein